MIRPTLRAVLIFAAGIPLALLIVIYNPGLWALSFDYALLVLIVGVSDLALACPRRRLNVKIAVPDRLYIGEQGAATVSIATGGFRRPIRFEAIAEQRGDIEPSEIVPGATPRAAKAGSRFRSFHAGAAGCISIKSGCAGAGRSR